PQVGLHPAPHMDRKNLLNFAKGFCIFVGVVCFGWAVAHLPASAFGFGFLFVLAFSILIAPRMTLQIPRSRLFVNFSDALIFLSFLLYGGEAAIVLATLEMLANCFYNKYRGSINFGRHMIATNAAMAAAATAFTYLIWASFI